MQQQGTTWPEMALIFNSNLKIFWTFYGTFCKTIRLTNTAKFTMILTVSAKTYYYYWTVTTVGNWSNHIQKLTTVRSLREKLNWEIKFAFIQSYSYFFRLSSSVKCGGVEMLGISFWIQKGKRKFVIERFSSLLSL